jgi:hypothetical protein
MSATIASAKRLAKASMSSGGSGGVAVAEAGGDEPVTVKESAVVMAVLGWEWNSERARRRVYRQKCIRMSANPRALS